MFDQRPRIGKIDQILLRLGWIDRIVRVMGVPPSEETVLAAHLGEIDGGLGAQRELIGDRAELGPDDRGLAGLVLAGSGSSGQRYQNQLRHHESFCHEPPSLDRTAPVLGTIQTLPAIRVYFDSRRNRHFLVVSRFEI